MSVERAESTEYGAGSSSESELKQRLGHLRSQIKRIDLREAIVTHPFTALGIGVAAGALIGFVRPMPRRGRISKAMFAMATAFGIRMLRDMAFQQLRGYVKQAMRAEGGGDEVEPEHTGYQGDPYGGVRPMP
jgi:hypothetical protein